MFANTLNGTTTTCCLAPACGAVPTVDTVPGVIAVSSKGCLSLIQTDSKIASYQINQNTCCLSPCCDVTFPVTCAGAVVCGEVLQSQQALAYSPDGKCLLAADAGSNNLSIFKVKDNCCLCKSKSLTVNAPSSLAFSPTTCCLFVGEQGYPIASYSVSNCKARFNSFTTENKFLSPILAISADGTCLAVIDGGTVYLYCVNVCDDCSLCCKPTSQVKLPGWIPTSLAFSPDGSCLVVTSSGSADNAIYTFCVTNCHIIPSGSGIFCSSKPNGTGSNPVQAVFSPVSASTSPTSWCLAVAYQTSLYDRNGIVQLFTVASDTCTFSASSTLYDPESTLNNDQMDVPGRSVAFSPNGSCLFFVTQYNIWSYNVVSCPSSEKSSTEVKETSSSDDNKIFMYGAGIAAVGLFGWMLTR